MLSTPDRLKGGRGGAGTRMRERFHVDEPPKELLEKYYLHYSGSSLHFGLNVKRPGPRFLFGCSTPLNLDLGCGRGEYAVTMARDNPSRKFVGIDFHKRSLFLGVNSAASLALNNVKFIMADLRLLIPYIPCRCADNVSILFPAPMEDSKNKKHEVMRAPLINQVGRVLRPGGRLVFASDARDYFVDKVGMIEDTGLYDIVPSAHGIGDGYRTRYQEQWENKGIATNSAEFVRKNGRITLRDLWDMIFYC